MSSIRYLAAARVSAMRSDAEHRARACRLRVSLVAATLLLVACGLAVSGIVVTSILHNSQIRRVDQTLLDASRGWALAPAADVAAAIEPRPAARLELLCARHLPRTAAPGRSSTTARPNLRCPRTTTWARCRARSARSTAPAPSGGRFRCEARTATDHRRHRPVRLSCRPSASLAWSQLGIGVAVLLVLGLASYAVVYRSLRPLAEVEQTAAAIAGGQLDRRVPERDPRTEVGRLSLALNGMLAQIQQPLRPRRSRRRSWPATLRTACDGSSPTPATSCVRR